MVNSRDSTIHITAYGCMPVVQVPQVKLSFVFLSVESQPKPLEEDWAKSLQILGWINFPRPFPSEIFVPIMLVAASPKTWPEIPGSRHCATVC